jgi:hypothetical protein
MVSTLLNPCRQWSILSPDSRHGTVTTKSRAAQKFVNVSEWKWQHWRPRTRHGTVNNTSIPTQPKKIFPVVVSRAYWRIPVPFHFLSKFRLLLLVATCGFSCSALDTDHNFQQICDNHRSGLFLTFPRKDFIYPFLFSCLIRVFSHVHLFVRLRSILMHFGHKDLRFSSKYNDTSYLPRTTLRGKKSMW